MAALTFQEVLPNASGYLTDRQIQAALEAGFLIEPGTWDLGGLRHASYTIRLGSRVEIERNPAGSSVREKLSISLTSAGSPLELSPGDTALLYSLENLRLPPSVLGFTVARGLLVVESLVPENTYIDPGFSGPIYTTVTNLSGRVLQLPYGAPIARLFLFRLGEEVEHPYQTGPAKGIAQQLDWRSGVAFPTQSAAAAAPAIALYSDLRSTERGGARTAELLRRNGWLTRLAVVTAAIWPPSLLTFYEWQWLKDTTGPLITSVVGGLVTAAIVLLIERLWRKAVDAG